MAERSPLTVIHENLSKIGAIPLEEYLAADLPTFQPVWDVSSGFNKYSTPTGDLKLISQRAGDECQSDGELHPSDSARLSRTDTSSEPNAQEPDTQTEDGPVMRIANCCTEWRAGLVEPTWLPMHRYGERLRMFGCALQIKLSPECQRGYSVDILYRTLEDATRACATLAIDQGVLDFIKYGNGQLQPTPRTSRSLDDVSTDRTRRRFASIQEFAESIGNPKTDHIPTNWLNKIMTRAHGGLQAKFIVISEPTSTTACPGYLHGCVLRLTRPSGQPLTYILEPVLQKQEDVKNAVCLVAATQGVEDYIASVAKEVESRVTPEMRRLAHDTVLPLLTAEVKALPSAKIEYKYSRSHDACGCTMNVSFANPYSMPECSRSFTVSVEYKGATDAKVAALCRAYEEGVIEFLRFRGQKPSPQSKTDLAVAGPSSQATASNRLGRKRRAEEEGTHANASGNKKAKSVMISGAPAESVRRGKRREDLRARSSAIQTGSAPPYHVPYAIPGAVAITPYPPPTIAPHPAQFSHPGYPPVYGPPVHYPAPPPPPPWPRGLYPPMPPPGEPPGARSRSSYGYR
ncbi:hypothetical protein GLOTRDRAFT_140149 [Gloeophyllum trabeum ATCC 11539]|uniref:Uncharacterized protein n=1 Tax=Gloeophyllum trabeum (strain ATCC 11539 / FP-39264 / Madison 617) TaxID=670483 RepID=S7RGG2_GLOTA|nr:uncharacterized protein GLOTRDRAFT_140149 [Gloeophyllum trabeum ATCC 11539]EPQ53310.1 hypothetical protein GLOTRDRAFT_140149 [Gloeophyllum trabeum ATCC 11539]